MKWPIHAVAAALLATGPLLAVPSAHAQSRSGAPTMDKQTEAPPLSDEKLDAAANAITRVNALSKSYRERIATAAPDDRERLADEAGAALQKAVNDSGLSVEEYNSIIEVAQNDPQVQTRILQRLQTMPDKK